MNSLKVFSLDFSVKKLKLRTGFMHNLQLFAYQNDLFVMDLREYKRYPNKKGV